MRIVRLIHVKVAQDQMKEAERLWREDCAPLMKQARGMLSEELLKCVESPGEYISYSEWESEEALEAFRTSDAHAEIERHTKTLRDAEALVKHYSIIP